MVPLSKVVKACELTCEDKIIAVMGPTGCGKSTFIELATGLSRYSSSCHGVRSTRLSFEGISYVLVDTPGFDDTYRSDVEILELITEWVRGSYGRDVNLASVLYFNRITDNRMAGTAYRNLNLFKKLCGDQPAKKVTFVTTMWDQIPKERGEQREKELKKYWKPMLELGARITRFENTAKSALDIIKQVLVSDDGRAGNPSVVSDTTVNHSSECGVRRNTTPDLFNTGILDTETLNG